jgi:hypothetical protein
MNSDRGAGSHATRFISLGAVANSSKAKWMHALALDPVASMSIKDLCAKPEHCTDSPYRHNKRKVRITRRRSPFAEHGVPCLMAAVWVRMRTIMYICHCVAGLSTGLALRR